MLYVILAIIIALSIGVLEWKRTRRNDRINAKAYKAMVCNKKQREIYEAKKKYK